MSKQTQSNTSATKTPQKPAPARVQEMVAASDAASLLDMAGAASHASSAQRLSHPNLPRIQRQMMAGRMGQQQGNGRLGQVMVFVRQSQQTIPSHLNKIQTVHPATTERYPAQQPELTITANPSGLMRSAVEKESYTVTDAVDTQPLTEVPRDSAQQSHNPSNDSTAIQRGVRDFLSNAWEGAQSLGSRALSGLQRLGSGVLSKLQQLGSGVMAQLEQMGEAAVTWGPRIARFVANPVGGLTGTLWFSFPRKIKLLLIDTILEYSDAISRRLRSGLSAFSGPIWPLIGSFMNGFIQRMSQVDDNEKVTLSDKLARIMSGGSLDFLWGVIKGLILGLWDVIKMPYDLVVGLIDGVQFITQVLRQFGLEAIQAGAQMMEEALPAAFDGLRQMIMNPQRAIQFIQTIWDSISGAVSRVGAGLAGALLGFIRLPDEQMGEHVGRFAAEFAVDVLLAVFTAGGGALLRQGAAIIRRFMSLFRRGGRALGQMVGMIRSAVEPLLSGVRRIGQLFRNSRFGGWMDNFGQWLNRLSDSVGEVANRTTRRGRAGSGSRAVHEGLDDVGDASRRGRRIAGEVTEGGQEYIEARTITAANERMGTPAPVLIRLLSGRFPSRRFRSVQIAPGHSRIVMRAILDSDYHPDEQSLSEQVQDEFDEAQNLGSGTQISGDTQNPLSLDETRSSLGEGPESSAMSDANASRAGMTRQPQHHVLPQEHRTWFEERGFAERQDIDRFTVSMGTGEHQAIHGGGNWRLGREWRNEWNRRIMRELRNAETAKGSQLTVQEIWRITTRLMREYQIPQEFIPYRN